MIIRNGRFQRNPLWLTTLIYYLALIVVVQGYHHKPCSHHAASDFSLPNCYLPDMDDALPLSKASFLFSHDAASGYIRIGVSKTGLSSFYSKTQQGNLYEQLNNGARALDLRPLLLANGTVIFNHGVIRIPIAFESALTDAVRWTEENPDELVLLLTSHFGYENDYQYNNGLYAMTVALQTIYDSFGIPYLSCSDIFEWTVGEAKQAASLFPENRKGYILAVDGHDYYGTFCGKANWIESEVVTCWGHNNRTSCKNSNQQWEKLKNYALASANNEATDNRSQLGPPASLNIYPFNEIQALWQVDAHAVAMGISHFSSILEDNYASNVNAKMVDLIYDGEFTAISLLAVDNVALHGNALLSVLRHTCGQSVVPTCGRQIPKPPMRRWRIRKMDLISFVLFAYAVIFIGRFFQKRPKLVVTLWARLCDQASSDVTMIEYSDRHQELLEADQRPSGS